MTAAASAQPAKKNKPAKVVNETTRGSFGEILTNKKRPHPLHRAQRDLHRGLPDRLATAAHAQGQDHARRRVPSGLGTTRLGARLQVTYKGKPLYTFYQDTKTSTAARTWAVSWWPRCRRRVAPGRPADGDRRRLPPGRGRSATPCDTLAFPVARQGG